MADLTLEQINALLDKKLKPLDKKLEDQQETLDAISAELHEVHTLASSTLDLVQITREKFRPAIDEAREHLGLSPIE